MLQKNVLEYLDASAARCGGKTAFTDETTSVTFAQMRDQARRLGTFLAKTVQGVNGPVAVFIDRTACTLTAMQAVLYSGNYYVPVDNKMPEARMRKILGQIHAKALLYAQADEAQALALADCCLPVSMEAGFCWKTAGSRFSMWTRSTPSSPPAPPAHPRVLWSPTAASSTSPSG